jgi:asparagine synthase (glutamine-hydrolysing)
VCGICGTVGIKGHGEGEAIVRRMAAALAHRGPDDEGFLCGDPRAPSVTLGMRRLSIIDPRGGHQPIWNEAHDVAVIFNGEIYNFRELRDTLECCGHRFTTGSDTEVLVHGWEEWGEDLLAELRGMFAFALLDLRRHFAILPVLFLARDALGIKPLYYAESQGKFLFASEVRALIASGQLTPQISLDALTAYLLFGSVSEPVTLVEGVYSVPPGHCVVLHVPERRHEVRARPWWAGPPMDRVGPRGAPGRRSASNARKPGTIAEAGRALRPLLEDAVRTHLVADVPVGLFLSSGLDSTTIAALAGRERGDLRSFTASFPETEYDEAPTVRRIAERCGTCHEEVPLTGDDMLTRLDEALLALDQPTMDGINTYTVCWAARQVGLKVALSGLGGDEIFAGYRTFDDTWRLARATVVARKLPRMLRRASAPLVERLAAFGATPDASRKAAAAWRAPRALPHAYFFSRALFPPGELDKIATPRLRRSAVSPDGIALVPTWLGWLERAASEASRWGPNGGVSWLELRTYMASTLLRDTDSVSMDRSLEVRVPLLDRPLVECVLALPESVRRQPGVQKALLVEAVGDVLPREALTQSKRTFTLPWEHWLRGPLRARVEASLSEPAPALATHLHPGGMGCVWKAFVQGRTSWSRPWSLYVLNEWCRRHLTSRAG